MFGLIRAGYTVLTLSPRLSALAIVKLITETQVESLTYHDSPQLSSIASQVEGETSVQTLTLVSRDEYDEPGSLEPPFERVVDRTRERERFAVIMHSSGSTGLPKPIYIKYTRYTCCSDLRVPYTTELMTLPLIVC